MLNAMGDAVSRIDNEVCAEITHLENFKLLTDNPNLKFKTDQILCLAFGEPNPSNVRHAVEHFYRKLLLAFRLDSELRFTKQWARYMVDGWLEAPVGVLEAAWKMTKDSRKNAAFDLREAGLIDYRTVRYQEGVGVFKSRVQIRPNVAKILHFLSLTGDAKTYEFEITEAANIREIGVKSIWSQKAPLYTFVHSESVPSIPHSQFLDAQKNEEPPVQAAPSGGETLSITPEEESGIPDQGIPEDHLTTELPAIRDVPEDLRDVILLLKHTFPDVWSPEILKQLKQLVEFPCDDLRMSPENVKFWIRLRRGEDFLQEADQNPWQVECDLPCLLKNWSSIWRFVQKHRYVSYRNDTESETYFLEHVNAYITSLVPEVQERFLDYNKMAITTKRPGMSLVEFLFADSWWPLTASLENSLVSRFVMMQELRVYWPELVAKHQKLLGLYLRANPAIYLALKDHGYAVDQWLGEERFFDWYGTCKAQVRCLRLKNAVTQHWCGDFGRVDNLVTGY